MSDQVAARIAELNPFRSNKEDDDDKGEQIGEDSIGHRIHDVQGSQFDLRVSRALRAFLSDKKVLSETEAGVDSDSDVPTDALRALVAKQSIIVPAELTDRSHPLPEYFVSSSHNTYLLAHQLYGASCASAYRTAIRTGSRCVEIDAWDDSNNPDEPKVTHGFTLVSSISFRIVCETIRDVLLEEIRDAEARPGHSPSPVLLSLENHCGPQGQMRLVEIMKEVLGDLLLSKPVREGSQNDEHVTLADLGARIAVIVEHHIAGEVEESDSDSDDDTDDEEEKAARKEYKDKKRTQEPSIIIPELAELGVYAQSVKPSDNSWYAGTLTNGPHHHLINVSESGLASHLPEQAAPIAVHNSRHLMRVFPKGTRIASSNLKPVPFWGLGAQICALNWQTFGTSNQLNDALFTSTDGYILKPAALRAGGSGQLSKGGKKRLRLHVAGATDIPLHDSELEAESIKPYLTCTLYHPGSLSDDPPKRKTSPYRQHRLGFLHRGENPPPTDPVWDEVLEWEYDDSELVFVRMLIKSDESWSRNPMFVALAVRLEYLTPGWNFFQMLDLKGRDTTCSVLAKFEIEDA